MYNNHFSNLLIRLKDVWRQKCPNNTLHKTNFDEVRKQSGTTKIYLAKMTKWIKWKDGGNLRTIGYLSLLASSDLFIMYN